jgi:Arc/MetJ-type ribon-helix-helix transcriptional regulator
MTGMKLSVSLPDDDLAFLDAYAQDRGIASRSAAVQAAVALLRAHALRDDYTAAFAEWEDSGEAALWDATVGDGLDD